MMVTTYLRRGFFGATARVLLALGLALAVVPLIPGVARAEGEVPANVAYATSPQSGTGNQYNNPYQWWKVYLAKGDTINVSIVVTSGGGDAVYLNLCRPGTKHAKENSSVGYAIPGAPLTYTATQTGDYLFLLYSAQYYDTAYTFTWTRTLAPVTVPGAPTGVSATPGVAEATVSWTPPASDGGAAITLYTATASPGGATCTSASTSCTVGGLANGQPYTFTVKATNAAGEGPASDPSVAVTPALLAQTATAHVPKTIKYRGRTVLLKKAVRTNAGTKATSKVTVSPRGKKYAKVMRTSKGKVTIKTFGKKQLEVTLKLTASATGQYAAYSDTKTWTVKK